MHSSLLFQFKVIYQTNLNRLNIKEYQIARKKMAYPQLVLLSVHYDCSNLLVHEDQDGDQKSRECTGQVDPPGILTKREHKPSSV